MGGLEVGSALHFNTCQSGRQALFLHCTSHARRGKKRELVTAGAYGLSTAPIEASARMEGATANYEEARLDEVANGWKNGEGGRASDATLHQEAERLAAAHVEHRSPNQSQLAATLRTDESH